MGILIDEQHQVLSEALSLLTEVYPRAQEAFLHLEVLDSVYSRQVTVVFVETLDLISTAVTNADRQPLDDARDRIERMAYMCYSQLITTRKREVERFRTLKDPIWWLLMKRNPFTPDLSGKLGEAEERLTRCKGTAFSESVGAMKHYLYALEEVLVEIEPHKVYDRVFSYAVSGAVLVCSACLGAVIL